MDQSVNPEHADVRALSVVLRAALCRLSEWVLDPKISYFKFGRQFHIQYYGRHRRKWAHWHEFRASVQFASGQSLQAQHFLRTQGSRTQGPDVNWKTGPIYDM